MAKSGKKTTRAKRAGHPSTIALADPRPVRSQPVRVLVAPSAFAGMEGIREYARQRQWLITTGPWFNNLPPRAVARHHDVSGIIIRDPPPIDGPRRHRLLKESPVPIVVIDWWMEAADCPVPRVGLDHFVLGRQVAEHFLERRFRHLAYCLMGRSDWALRQMAGLEETARAAGAEFYCLTYEPYGQRYGWDAATIRRWMAGELIRLPKPLGLMVESDHMALEAVQSCDEHGLLVPERVAVVGCWNDPDICLNASIPLSSVDVGCDRHGYQAAALLDAMMRGSTPNDDIVVIPPRGVVVRQSSDITAVPHLEVAKAVHFIMHHHTNPMLQVDDVVEATTLSRPGLNLAFQKHMRCGVADFVRRTRLKLAMDLLASTAMPVGEVAARCGYRDHQHLRATMIREHGLSPRAWRKGRPGPGAAVHL